MPEQNNGGAAKTMPDLMGEIGRFLCPVAQNSAVIAEYEEKIQGLLRKFGCACEPMADSDAKCCHVVAEKAPEHRILRRISRLLEVSLALREELTAKQRLGEEMAAHKDATKAIRRGVWVLSCAKGLHKEWKRLVFDLYLRGILCWTLTSADSKQVSDSGFTTHGDRNKPE